MTTAGRLAIAYLKRGILLFWAIAFALLFFGNICDALGAARWFPQERCFVSGHSLLLRETITIEVDVMIFGGRFFLALVSWEGVCLVMHWRAFRLFPDTERRLPTALGAFGVSLALWAGFVLADEALVAVVVDPVYMRLLIAELVSLMAVLLLPEAD